MLPSLLFLALYTVATGYLHYERQFFRSGISPVLLNIFWIGTVLALRHRSPHEAVAWLALGIVGGYVAQWLFVTGPVFRFMASQLSFSEWIRPHLFSQENRSLIRSLSLTLLGVGATQLNTLFDTLFALLSHPEGPAYLSYAIRPQQLPLALFSVALGSAALPALSRAMQRQDEAAFRSLLSQSLQKMVLIIVPCTIALFILGPSGVNLLYGRGAFSSVAVGETTKCLFGYGVGLLPMSVVIVLTPSFYARSDYRTPAIASTLNVCINLLLNLFFVLGLGRGPWALALATSCASAVHALHLWRALPTSPESVWQRDFWRALQWSLVGALCVCGLESFRQSSPLFWRLFFGESIDLSRHLGRQLFEVVSLSIVFVLPLLRLGPRLYSTVEK